MLPAFMVSTAIRPADGGADRLPPRAGGLTSGRIRSFALVATAALGLSTVSPARAQVTSVNGQIAYLACGPSSIPFFPDQCDVWVMNADGTGQTNLTHTTDSNEIGPAWSPGGTQIAFAASIPDPPLGVRADTDRQLYTAAMGDLEGMELTEWFSEFGPRASYKEGVRIPERPEREWCVLRFRTDGECERE